MPLFQVDIEKRLNSEFWSNRWFVRANDLSRSTLFAQQIVTAERGFHAAAVTFTRFRSSTVAAGDDAYVVVPIGEVGLRGVGALLPLFNTLRMDFTAATGRPSRKYFRGVLGENDIDGAAMTTDFSDDATIIEGIFAIASEEEGIVDPQEQLLTAAVVHNLVQMRQLRRGKRRRQGIGIFP